MHYFISPVLWQFLVNWLTHFALFPPEASAIAPYADALYFFLILISLVGMVIVMALVGGFSILYRKERNPEATQIEGSTLLEATWTIIPLALFMVCFVWGALLYFRIYNPPTNAMNIYIVGKQWMWKAEHPGGQHEINALHVPMGEPVQLTMISQDVFHSYSIPGISREARGHPGAIHDGVVYGYAAGHVSPVLHAVLRHPAFADDRRSRGDEAGRIRGVDGGFDQRHVAGAEWRAALCQHGLQCLPLRQCRGARPEPRRSHTRRGCSLPTGRMPWLMTHSSGIRF